MPRANAKQPLCLKLNLIESSQPIVYNRRNQATGWRYRISTGPQCLGLISQKRYKLTYAARRAGEVMIKRLEDFAR